MDFRKILNNIDLIINTLNEMRMRNYRENTIWIHQAEPNMLNIFALIDKVTSVPLELLVSYWESWQIPSRRHSEHDMIERIKVIMNMCLISSLSAVEYFTKDCLRKSISGPIFEWYKRPKEKRYVSFGSILSQSKKAGVISELSYEYWDGLRKLRNALVHNNGVSNFEKEWDIDGVTARFRKNKPVRYKLWAPSSFISTANRLTRLWAGNYLKTHILQPHQD